jgi:hypothetical protein
MFVRKRGDKTGISCLVSLSLCEELLDSVSPSEEEIVSPQ